MKVSIDQVLNRTKIRLRLLDTTIHDATLEKLINEAATHHLDTLNSYIISCCEIEIDDCNKAKLPESAVDLICFSFPNAQGCTGNCLSCMNDRNPNYQCSCPVWYVADRNILTQFCDMGCSAGLAMNFFDVQNGYIVFNSSVNQPTVKVWFRGYNVDQDGIAVIDEKQERALSAYASWQFAIAYYKNYFPEQRREWKMEWIAQKAWLKGDANQRDAKLHKVTLSSIARAILINPSLTANRNV